MINAILKGIFKLIISLVSIVFYPIDVLIETALPGLQTAINAIGTFLTYLSSALGWVLSVFGLSSNCLSLIVLYFTFKLTIPFVIYTIKLAIRWYDKLKPQEVIMWLYMLIFMLIVILLIY